MVKKLLMGNEAFAHAALEAGVRVVAGYPGTPSSELVETVAAEHAAGRAQGVHVEWSTNEKAALELLAGAAYCGARVLFTCKQVGLNVASDALMSLNYVGVKGGTVLFVADDPGPISSQTEQDTRRFAMFAKVPVLDPATPEQGFAMMKAAFDLSERYHTPVIVRPTTRIDHASTFFDIAEQTQARPVPEEGFERGPRWVIFPKRAWEAHGEINDRLRAMAHDFAADPVFAAFNPVLEGGGEFCGDALLDDGALSKLTGGADDAGGVVDGAAGSGSLDDRKAPSNVSRETFGCDDKADAVVESEGRRSAPRVGILAGGVSAMYAREALSLLESRAAESRARGLLATTSDASGANVSGSIGSGVPSVVPSYRFMQVGTPFPFPEQAIARFTDGLDAVLVLEELDHVLEDEVLAFAGRTHASFDVLGKLTGHARDRGENDVDDITARIQAFFAEHVGEGSANSASLTVAPDLPVRPPVLCAGCPHRGSFYAVKRALGKREAVLCGDIGCYTLGNAKPLDAVDTCLCMGAGITMAQGFAVAEPQKKQVAFVGDSTFFASGLTGVANAVYNGHDITVVVLDNATTAMTGGQPHPGTGITLMGPKRRPISIEAVLRALGVECVVRANPLNLDEAVSAAREAIDFEGPSVVLFESPCVQLARPAAPASVDADKCTGCKKCITEIGCPGIGFNPDAAGPKSGKRGLAFVDASLCNGCGLCTQICPFAALSVPVACQPPEPADAAGASGAESCGSKPSSRPEGRFVSLSPQSSAPEAPSLTLQTTSENEKSAGGLLEEGAR